MKKITAETKYMLLNVIADNNWMPIEFIEEKFSEEPHFFATHWYIEKNA